MDDKELTNLDKLYLAMAEAKVESHFNTLCYSLDITSLWALKDYSARPDKKIMDSGDMDIIKEKIDNKHFNFEELSKQHKRSNVVETCIVKGIPVIQKQDVTVIRSMVWGTYAGLVCEALWTNNGVEEKVCLRYGTHEQHQFLHEAEMATLLRHKNILVLHGVIIASSYSPSVALVVEFAEYGNLYESSANCSVEQLCRNTIQAATALEHLEKMNVIHRAVKSFNCLVVSKNQMKLAGLGACQFESEMKKKLPVSYTQKDVVHQFARVFSTYFARYDDIMTPEIEIAKNIKSHDVYGPLCPPHFCDVFDRCLLPNPDARPSFSEIRQSLVAHKYPSKVRATRSFKAESAEFISCKSGELITLISKDRHRRDKTAWLGETQNRKIGFVRSEYVEELLGYDIMDDSTVPLEIRARGPRAEAAFQKALQNGRVKVYRGRIMLLGQDRAGKTSLKKSLLGLPFNPEEESTVGVEVDPSKCEVDVGQVKNWEPTERKKLEVTEFVEDIARIIARDLNEPAAEREKVPSVGSLVEQVDAGGVNNSEASPTVPNSTPDASHDIGADIGRTSDNVFENSSQTHQNFQLNIDTTEVLSEDVTDLVLHCLQNLKLEDDIKTKEVILTLWDFAGQHLYYASHSVFLSARAVYVLVYNLNKSLNAEAEPCVRQGIHDIVLDNPNSETNLDNLMSWLVSVHSIRRTTAAETGRDIDSQGVNFRYLRPPVFIVGTNADQPSEEVKKIENCIKRSIWGKTYEKHVIRPFFAVDNTKSQNDGGVQNLQKRIMEVLKEEPYMGEEVPLRWFKFEKVVEALVARQIYHMDLDRLLNVIIQECRIDDEDELAAMLNFYHDLGVIVKHGRTVVLQAQWLIDLFKQLITVKPFDELNPLYSDCWRDLEESGVLRMTLVDHVFADFIHRGLHKQDILDMMELYGLIAKFSWSSAEIEKEQRYFVPSQLRSSPYGLCEIKPSKTDPCPLYLHFLDGFVPHGLFPQLLSRCIGWCSEHGLKEAPQLFNNGTRLFIGMQTIFDLILICRKRFIKVVLKRNLASAEPSSNDASAKMASGVRSFIEATLKSLSHDLSWLHNLRYELSVACSRCLRSTEQCTQHRSSCCTHDDCLHLLRVPEKSLICPKSFCDETIKIHGLDKWFQVHSNEIGEEKMNAFTPEASTALEQRLSLKSGTPSSDDLLLLASELGTSWKRLGRVLGLPEHLLEQIEEDKRELFEKCYGMLRRWTEARGSAATYKCLAQALQHPVVGRPKLAAKYCDVSRDTRKEEVISSVPRHISDTSELSFPVFLSYQWDLQDTVKTLKYKIEARGIQCWVDIGEMGGGDTLFSKIDAGIRACKVFVCCVTEKYIQSDRCQREAALADRLKKPIIPLLFEDISWPPKEQLSLILARLFCIRISETSGTIHDSELDQLMKKVQQFVER